MAGGYAHECIDMLDVLLPPVEVASLKGREDGEEYTEVWKTKIYRPSGRYEIRRPHQ